MGPAQARALRSGDLVVLRPVSPDSAPLYLWSRPGIVPDERWTEDFVILSVIHREALGTVICVAEMPDGTAVEGEPVEVLVQSGSVVGWAYVTAHGLLGWALYTCVERVIAAGAEG